MTATTRSTTRIELDALEARMGEMASLLSEMADALTSYPEGIRIVETNADADGDGAAALMHLNASEWPTIGEIQQLLADWRRLRGMVG